MVNISQYIQGQKVGEELQEIFMDIEYCIKTISAGFSDGIVGYADTKNAFGEQQVKMDVVSNKILVEQLRDNKSVALIGSEELADPVLKEVDGNAYSVVFDPLDGSSVVDANMAVGTVIGIYEGDDLIGKTGRDQVAAILAVYGPQTLIFLALKNGDLVEFVLDKVSNEFVLLSDDLKLEEDGKYFAPGDLNSMMDQKWYHEALHYWLKNGYKLRYSGSMAADVNHILKKKGGLFLYPGSKKNPMGKLRYLYECAPVALLIENAGGAASNGKDAILDIQIQSMDQTEPLFIGSKNEVKRMEELLAEVDIQGL